MWSEAHARIRAEFVYRFVRRTSDLPLALAMKKAVDYEFGTFAAVNMDELREALEGLLPDLHAFYGDALRVYGEILSTHPDPVGVLVALKPIFDLIDETAPVN